MARPPTLESNQVQPWRVGIRPTSSEIGETYLAVSSPFLDDGEAWLCRFVADGKPISPTLVNALENNAYQLVLRTSSGDVTVEITVETHSDRFVWSITLRGTDQRIQLYFPFLRRLSVGPHTRWIDLFSLENQQGNPLLRYRNYQAPLVTTDGNRALVVVQDGSMLGNAYTPACLMDSPGLEANVGSEPRTVYQGQILFTTGGWRAAFGLVRTHLRQYLDLTEYAREDLKWYNEQLVQHFTFLYGREILDLEHGVFDVDRFLDEGEQDFGGYDGFLIWGGYPRVGIDERTQWEFYDDMPGGRPALRAMSARARSRGVRFFVPYLPWERSHELHGHAGALDEEELSRLIVDLEADGVFLDTLGMITPQFRQAIDRHKPGVVFCSELRTQGKALEIVTGCWEQSYTRDGMQGNWSAAPESMPMVDLWRFVLPEHRLFVINRHAMADDRIRITQRAFFNGMGWVVWMDIFGLTLPYTPYEAALLKKCRTIFRENLDALNGDSPTPLVETLHPDLFANEFAGGTQRMWTFYNQAKSAVIGPLLHFTPRPDHHMVDVWHRCTAQVIGEVTLTGKIDPIGVGCIVEYPAIIEVDAKNTNFRLRKSDGNEFVLIDKGGGETETFAPSTHWMPLPAVRGAQHIRLMRGRRVLDQIHILAEN